MNFFWKIFTTNLYKIRSKTASNLEVWTKSDLSFVCWKPTTAENKNSGTLGCTRQNTSKQENAIQITIARYNKSRILDIYAGYLRFSDTFVQFS